MKRPFTLLLTGEPNCGKSTIAYELLQKGLRNCLVIDGDKHREMQFLGKKLGFSKDDIMENNRHVVKMAKFAQGQGFNVLIPQIAPYREQRKAMRRELENFLEVYLIASKDARSRRPNFKDSELVYEEGGFDLSIPTDSWDIDKCVDIILSIVNGD